MKKHLLFNQSFGTEGSPNQTGETLTRENRIGLMSYLRRTLMLLFAVLMLSIANIGMAWGTDYTCALSSAYKVVGQDSITYFWISDGGSSTYKNNVLFFEVPSSTANGSVAVTGSNTASRYLYMYGTNGTVQDDTRGLPMAKNTTVYTTFTSGDILTNSTKYYLKLATTDDWKPRSTGPWILSVPRGTSGASDGGYIFNSDVLNTLPAPGITITADGISYNSSIGISHTGYNNWGSTSSASKYYQWAFSSALALGTYSKLRIHVWWGVTSANRTVDLYVNGSKVETRTLTTANTMEEFTYDAGANISSIKLVGGGGGGGSVFFRVAVEGIAAPSCTAPTSPTNGASTSSSRVVSWTAPGSAPAGGYLVAYSSATSIAPGDAVQAAGTNGNYTVVAVAAGTTTATLSALSASTTYNWWVRSKCGNSSFSSWVAGTAFTTDAAAPAAITRRMFLNLGGIWDTGQSYWVHVWDGSGNSQDVDMTQVGSTGYYYADVPISMQNIQYRRNANDNKTYDLSWGGQGENQCAKITAWHGEDGNAANPSSTSWEIYHDGRQTFALGNYVYYDNSVTQWSNVYFRIGKWNVSQAYEMTKEPGTKDLYSYQRTGTAWEGYEVFNFADNWANQNGNVYYPDNDKDTWSGNETNFARESLSSNRYYRGESPYVTSSYAHYHNLTELSAYTVTATGTNCTVTLEKCTDYSAGTYTALTSGGTVLPTQYIKVTVTPDEHYEFGSVVVTGVGTVTANTAGTPGVYYVTGNATVTATCTAIMHTITGAVNTAGYGSVSPASISVMDGSAISLSSNVLTCNGKTLTATPTESTTQYTYAFSNWSGVTNGATVSGNLTATANFTRTPKSYTLTWDLAGGKVTVAGTGAAVNATGTPNSEVAFGTAITAPTVTKIGYKFTDWDPSVESTMPAEAATYTATWTAKKYNIDYRDQGDVELSGCNHRANPAKHTYGSETTLKPAFKDGYVFGGWYTSSNCSTGLVTTIGATDYTASFKLFAKWTAMNLDALEGGTLYTASDMVPDGVEISESSQYYPGVSANNRFNILGVGNTNTTTGPLYSKTLSGTQTIDATDFTGSLYSANASTITSSLPTDHALQFKISHAGLLDIYCYDPVEMYLIEAEGSAVQLDASGTGKAKITKTVSAGTYYIYTDDTDKATRLYGLKFTPTYTVTLNDNGGKGDGSSSVIVTYNSATIASITNPTKDGYIFGGWYSEEGGTGSLVIDANGDLQASVDGYTGAGGIWTKTAATTLYAYWISNAVYDPDMSTEAKLTATLAAKFDGSNRWNIGEGIGVPNEDVDDYLTGDKYGLMFPKASVSVTYDLGKKTTLYKITLDIVAEISNEYACETYVEFLDEERDHVDDWVPTMAQSDDPWDKQELTKEYPLGLADVRYIEVSAMGDTYMGLTRFKLEYAPTKTWVVLDNQSATTAGTESVTATYGATTNLTSSITAPTKTGYVFGGYYTEENGKGTQLIDEDGAWLSSQTGYTDGSKNWQFPHPDLTLYAKWIEPCLMATITKNSSNYSLSSGETKDITSDATITSGGAVKLVNNYAGSRSFSFSSNGVAPGTSEGYVEIVFPSGSALGVGSIIRITGAGTAADEGLLLIDDEGNTIASQTKNGAIDFTYTVTAESALKYKDHIRIARAKTNSNNYFKSVSVLYCASCAPYTPTLTYSKTTIWMDDESLTASPTLNKDGSTGSATYISNNTDVATVDPSTGVVTAVAGGNVTITASIAADGTHCANTATCNLTIKQATCGEVVIAGVTLSAKDAGTPEGTLIASSSGYVVSTQKWEEPDGGCGTGGKLGASGNYICLTLKSGESFKNGDKVILDIATVPDVGDGKLHIYAGTSSAGTQLGVNASPVCGENEIILSGISSSTPSITLYRTDGDDKQNPYVVSMKVKRFICTDCLGFVDATENGNWNTAGNWIGSTGVSASVPTISDRVHIYKPVTVDINNAKASSVYIYTNSTNTGKVTIDAGKALIIAGKLAKSSDGTNYTNTAAADVIINSDRTTNGVGALVIGGETGTNKATVNFETKAKNDGGWVNQFIGSPFSDNEPYVDYAIQLYKFEPRANGDRGWWWTHSSGTMTPFWGYNVLYNDPSELDVTWTGTLNASTSKTISGLYYNGSSETDNMFANSWTAPIHVGEIEDADLVNASKTLYMFNAGTPAQEEGQDGSNAANTNTSPGTYISIPIHSATYAGIGVIPSMQAFYVEAQAAGASITLDYNKIVYTPALTSVGVVPNRAPKRDTEVAPEVIKLHVQSETGWAANTYVMGREDFAEGYEDGWDGAYIEGESQTPKLYTPSIDGNMFINCLPQIEGTLVSFRKGSDDSAYTFSFKYDGEEEYYLNDLKEQTSTLINNENTYMFSAEAEDATARFIISATPVQKVTTGVDSASGGQDAKVRKVIINDHIYIIRGGRMYSAEGALVK